MTIKITLLLSMTLNVALALAVLEKNSAPPSVPTDLRDAVADSPAEVPAAGVSLGSVAPAPVPAPAGPVGDWASYVKDAEDDTEVIVSRVFRTRAAGEKEMAAAADRARAEGNDVLFSFLMRDIGGGVFFVLRLDPLSSQVPVEIPRYDRRPDAYAAQIRGEMDRIERECLETLESGRR